VWGYGAGQFRLLADGVEDGWNRTDHLIIGEAEDAPAQSFDLQLSVIVVELLVVPLVNLAVEFDDQSQGFAGEVAVDRVLSAESQTVETTVADGLPELLLGEGLALPQIPGAFGSSLTRHAA
jgi:hypothetical protein